MNYELETRIRTEVRSGEKLLWSGQPAGGLRLRASDAAMIPFSLLWAGFAVFWEWSVVQQGGPAPVSWFMALWGIPFVLIGVYMVVGRFFVDAVQRGRTYYAVTNERVMILKGLWSRELKSISLRTLPEVTLTEGPGPRGTIQFGSSPWPASNLFRGANWPGAGKYQPPCFELIEEPRRVYEIIRVAQRDAAAVGA